MLFSLVFERPTIGVDVGFEDTTVGVEVEETVGAFGLANPIPGPREGGGVGAPELILLSRAPPPEVGVGRGAGGAPELILLSRAPPPEVGTGSGVG